MITGEEIGHFIRNPLTIKQEDLTEFSDLIEKYPYCSSLHLLYLKGLAIYNQLDFEKQLKTTAIHTPNRKHLFTLIHSGEPKIELVESSIESLNETDIIEEYIAKTRIEITPPEIVATLPEAINENIELDPIEIDIINKAIDVSFSDSEFGGSEEITELEEIPEKPIDELVQTENIELENEVEQANVLAQKSEGPLSFVEWLRQKQQGGIIQTKTIESTDIEENLPPKKTKFQIDAILNKFMNEEPRISKPIKEFYNPVENAKRSVEDSDTLVTETLAKVYVMQKNYSKAISAYEKLILLYPEKKTFFASQIEKIRE